jgi:cell wall-associated NlpC family hydrolase
LRCIAGSLTRGSGHGGSPSFGGRDPPLGALRGRRGSRDAPPARHARARGVAFAERQVGVRYRFGGISRRTGFDCSGLVYAAYRSIGRAIPHSTWGQMAIGRRVTFRDLRPGDLLFTEGGGHVVLVVSERAAVSAPHTGARVSYVRLSSRRARFAGARRLLR